MPPMPPTTICTDYTATDVRTPQIGGLKHWGFGLSAQESSLRHASLPVTHAIDQ